MELDYRPTLTRKMWRTTHVRKRNKERCRYVRYCGSKFLRVYHESPVGIKEQAENHESIFMMEISRSTVYVKRG